MARSGEAQDRVEIESGGTRIGSALEEGFEVALFARRYKPQMPLGHDEIGLALDPAQKCDGGAMALQGLAQQGDVACTSDAIGNGADDFKTFGSVFETRHQRSNRSGKPARIDDEEDGPAGLGGEFGGGGGPGGVNTVIEPHHTLAQHEVGVLAKLGNEARPCCRPHRPWVEIGAGPACGRLVEGRVDIVGADLGGRDAQALADQRACQPQRQGRLATARGGRGQDQPRCLPQERRSPAVGPLVSEPRSRRQPRSSMQRRYSSATTDWPTLRPASVE